MPQIVSAADWIEMAIIGVAAICSAIAMAIVIAFALAAQFLLSLSPVSIGVSAMVIAFAGMFAIQALVKGRL